MSLSAAARADFLQHERQPLFRADWLNSVFIHFSVDAEVLQPHVPYELDLCEGKAWVSLVAFTMRGMRLWNAGRLGARLTEPIGTHGFLNVRTYVRHGEMRGIYFLREFLPNRLSVLLGPLSFGLPYRWARVDYRNDPSELMSCVVDPADGTSLRYCAEAPSHDYAACAPGSLDEFLLERYVAFTLHPLAKTVRDGRVGTRQPIFFRVWHPPWPQVRVRLQLQEDSLLPHDGEWYRAARLAFATYSPGATDVWMGRPHLN
ncbi:MAG TPA: DUF2071 domain-containing protein [Planctomycetota bacterium]|nr:DUF2071 domain-containing protein [Planctomycetota bacterium]